MYRSWSCALVGAALLALGGTCLATPAGERPFVSGAAHGPIDSTLGNYAKHERHPIRQWQVRFDNRRCKWQFQSWVDVHESHAPLTLPLEGMLGFPAPAAGNWYSNGFLDLLLAGERLGTSPPKSVRVLETGERGRAWFVWQRPEGAWSVVFVLLPDDDKVFCCVRVFPADPNTPLDIRLTCYPAGQFHDGLRAVTTAARTVKQTQELDVDLAAEWWFAVYDELYDAGGRGDGGAAVLLDPSGLGSLGLNVSGYPVCLRVAAPQGRREVRMILWDSFFGKKNAEIIEYMKENAASLLDQLRTMSFGDQRLQSEDTATEAAEIARCLEALPDSGRERSRAEQLAKELAALRARLAASQCGLHPDEEERLAATLEAHRRLMWDLRWRELLETPQEGAK